MAEVKLKFLFTKKSEMGIFSQKKTESINLVTNAAVKILKLGLNFLGSTVRG